MSGLNLLVFREDRRRVSGHELTAALTAQLEQLCTHSSHDGLLTALLRAGELECGVADEECRSARPFELLTDRIADGVLTDAPAASDEPGVCRNVFQQANLQQLLDVAKSLPALGQLSISTPEGFAYYALHPLAYANILNKIPACESLLVVGIRSIGITLSAVTAAAARAKAIQVDRITVRPLGHPYDRTAEFTADQLGTVRKAVSHGSRFAVVDEGPGLSGSSFLAVAEALERAGAPAEEISLVSSHAPNVDTLCATDAERRWQRFRCIPVAAEERRPSDAIEFIGRGHWRNRLIATESDWPGDWVSFERLKYLSPSRPSSIENDRPRMFKFAGLGHYGDAVLARERKVADAGFGPMPRAESDGFLSYPWMLCPAGKGRALSSSDLSPEVIMRLADYCGFRLRAFTVELSDVKPLQQMADHNLRELGFNLTVELRLERPVIADGKMQPHEWLFNDEGALLKTDSGGHGDDHFFPGPTDIAWDLASAIVEWHMNEEQAREFLTHYRRVCGDDASSRIDGFMKAYAVFRQAYCLMAANAMSESDEHRRLQRAADLYRTVLMRTQPSPLKSLSALSAVTT